MKKAKDLHVGDVVFYDGCYHKVDALVYGSGLFGEDVEVRLVPLVKEEKIVFFHPDEEISMQKTQVETPVRGCNWLMRDNHTFRRLPNNDFESAAEMIRQELASGWTGLSVFLRNGSRYHYIYDKDTCDSFIEQVKRGYETLKVDRDLEEESEA